MFSVMAASSHITSSTSPLNYKTKTPQILIPSSLPSSLRYPYPTVSCFLASSSISISHTHDTFTSSVFGSTIKSRVSSILAVIEEESVATTTSEEEESSITDTPQEPKRKLRLSELYVCNLPRSCDISDLLEMFKPYGTVHSVEVSRNIETGLSRGCGYVIMTSTKEAKAAISALDRSEVGGREMRVRFSGDINSKRTILAKKNFIFESPHKVYVGNLAWSVQPEDLKEYFSRFGTVISSRLLYDRKGGKNRVYGFISFSSEGESNAALSSNGTEFRGRKLLVREVVKQIEAS